MYDRSDPILAISDFMTAIEYDEFGANVITEGEKARVEALVEAHRETPDAMPAWVSALASAETEGYARCPPDVACACVLADRPQATATSTALQSQLAVLGVARGTDLVSWLDLTDFAEGDLLRLHEVTLADGAEWARGQLRDCPVFITGTSKRLPGPETLGELVPRLCECLSTVAENAQYREPWENLVLASAIHQLFESIHPFVDGNGRVGRVLLFDMTKRMGLPTTAVSPLNRHDYYWCLDLRPAKLTRFLLKWMSTDKIQQILKAY